MRFEVVRLRLRGAGDAGLEVVLGTSVSWEDELGGEEGEELSILADVC